MKIESKWLPDAIGLGERVIELPHTQAADATGSGMVLPNATVDENTVGAGGLLHLDTDGNWIDADNAVDADMPCRGIALDSGTGAAKRIMLWGTFRLDAWGWTPGATLYAGTSGGITATIPTGTTNVQAVGFALDADTIMFTAGLNATLIKRAS